MKVTHTNCKNCPVYYENTNKENMIKYDICHKRNSVGCPINVVVKNS